jgi:pimeloyl-ACP methyl ester carboxylesterase
VRPSIADYAGAAIDVLDALGIERATVIGHHFFKQWTVAPDGSHLLEKWTRMQQWLPHPELVQRLVVDLFRAGEASEQGHFAVTDYRMEERLPSVRCPALLLFCTRDPFTTPERAEPLRSPP